MSLHELFYPKSIAVVGASPKTGGTHISYFHVLRAAGYKGQIYPVNPRYKEIGGLKSYPSLDDIPSDVDLAIVLLASKHALDIVKSAVKKRIKYLHFYTSGFSELGDADLETAVVSIAKSGNTRIIGPNCIGVHCTESGVTFFENVRQTGKGEVAFLGQSGGITHNFISMSQSRRLKVNKVVSYGNQADLAVAEFFEYFGEDEAIKVIAAYIEDIKDGHRFIESLKSITPHKPVIILKGGTSKQGAKVAASHTGAMSTRRHIWDALMKQFNCIQVDGFEQILDVAMIATTARTRLGSKVGFLGSGGGTSVLITDLAVRAGLSLPELHLKTQKIVGEKIGSVNTSTTNPVDLGQFGFDFNIMAHTMRAMEQDDRIDIIIPYFSIDFIASFQSDQIESGPKIIVDTVGKMKKPVIPILSRFREDSMEIEQSRIRIYAQFRQAGLPVFYTIEDAIYAVSAILNWQQKKEKRDGF